MTLDAPVEFLSFNAEYIGDKISSLPLLRFYSRYSYSYTNTINSTFHIYGIIKFCSKENAIVPIGYFFINYYLHEKRVETQF